MVLLTERGTDGLRLFDGSFQKVDGFAPECSKGIRSFQWSPDGRLLAFCNNQESLIVKAADWTVVTRVS